MFAKTKTGAIYHTAETRDAGNPFFPQLALRRRTNQHPMVMFAALAAIGLGSMALVPTSGAALTSVAQPTVKLAETIAASGKGARLVQMSDSEIACYGQAWGAQDKNCLNTIALESGLTKAHQVRMIASAAPDSQRPNIY